MNKQIFKYLNHIIGTRQLIISIIPQYSSGWFELFIFSPYERLDHENARPDQGNSKASGKKRMYVVERTMHIIRKQEDFDQLMIAAEGLHEEYSTNRELTAFTTLDMEDFYETR
ncbi:MAG: hypothetical protein EA364_14510 [Balneolaceae bacterium]|nr:MAG: hypothetical protein EA364_14510 [Balneolaceae bacterium]